MLCSFQSPVEVPGVSNSDFLRLAANARRKQLGQEELGPLEFYGYVMPKVPQHTFRLYSMQYPLQGVILLWAACKIPCIREHLQPVLLQRQCRCMMEPQGVQQWLTKVLVFKSISAELE